MNRRTLGYSFLLILVALSSTQVSAQTAVSIAELKNYELGLQQPEVADMVPGAPLLATYQPMTQKHLVIANPFENAHVQFAVTDGTRVNLGQRIATITGPSVEHFFHRLETVKAQYDVAQQQHKSKYNLYQRNALSADDWQNFLDQYIRLSDQMHEIKILLSRFHQLADDSAELKAPIDGVWQSDADDMRIGYVIDRSEIRLAVQAPNELASSVHHISVQGERFTIDYREQSTRNGFTTLWSSPLTESTFTLYQRMSVIPLRNIANAFKVPGSAVSSLNGEPVVFSVDKQTIHPIPVRVSAVEGEDYYVAASTSLDNPIVTHSVAALKGIIDSREEAQQ